MPVVTVGSRTDVGRVRSLNEDALFVGTYLWAVADGMGGHAAGDVASDLATRTLVEVDHEAMTVEELAGTIRRANGQIADFGLRHPESAGLGTTLAGVAEVVLGGVHHWAVFNIGDSRVYRLCGGELARATIDHSEVEELVLEGQLTEEEARVHPSRNIITRALGSTPPPEADIWVLPQSADEIFLVCSDGLTTELLDHEIEGILTAADPQDAADELVNEACLRGGRDNVSAIVLLVVRPSDEAADDTTHPRDPHTGNGNHG